MVKIEGTYIKELAGLSFANRKTKNAIRKWFYRVGYHLKRTALKEIQRKPRSGITRRVRNPLTGHVFNHTASVPGETAANMFGNYGKGLDFKVSSSQMLFGDYVHYARALELGTKGKKKSSVVTNRKGIIGGTRSGGGIFPRPGLALAIVSNEGNAYRDAVTDIKVALERDE